MTLLRTILVLALVASLAGYGVAASFALHSHRGGEVFAVHAMPDSNGHDAGFHHAADHEDENSTWADHHESGLHSHSIPQFTADTAEFALWPALASSIHWLRVMDALALRAVLPPFKPPRAYL